MDLHGLKSPLDRLARKGDARDTFGWREWDPDYVWEFGLTQDNVPGLLELARLWSDAESLPDEEHLWSAPIHAWRALAQLAAVEVVQPLLDMQEKLDAAGDQWYLDEFHDVFGLIGGAAILPAASYLADRTKQEFPRISAANGLCQIGKLHEECRPRVVDILTSQLAEHEAEKYSLNGFLVGYLLDLKAVESAEIIERAFAAGMVDETVAGDWGVARRELGVQGLGLIPDDCPARRRPMFAPHPFLGDPEPTATGEATRQKMKDRKAKAKRRQQQKSRRRNRRAK